MKNYSLKLKIFQVLISFILNEKETAEEYSQIHSQREGEDSPGNFRFERAGKINSRTLSKNPPHRKQSFNTGLVQHRASLWYWV